MKRIFLSLTISFISILAAAEDLTCPTDQQKATIDQWRDKAVEKVLHGDYGIVKETFTKCFNGQVPSCLADVEDYNLEASGSLRSSSQDSVPADPTLKSELDLPPEFLVKGTDGKVILGQVAFPPDIMKLAKEKGWKAVGYKTRGSGGFDGGANLVLVVIPGADKDIYLQISPPPVAGDGKMSAPPSFTGDASHGQNALTVITVDKTKTPPVGQLRLLNKESYTSPSDAPYKWSNNLSVSSCTACHTVPLRSISPRGYLVTNGEEKRLTPEEEQKITEINEMMLLNNLSFGQLKANGHTHQLGPSASLQPYGWAPPGSNTREEEFIKNCATQVSTVNMSGRGGYYADFSPSANIANVDWKKVRDNMNCMNCHNNTVRGYLHSDFSIDEIQHKILVDRSMPPSTVLTGDERLALANCLVEEQMALADEWKKSGTWMKRKFCETATPVRQRHTPPSATAGGSPTANVPKTQ